MLNNKIYTLFYAESVAVSSTSNAYIIVHWQCYCNDICYAELNSRRKRIYIYTYREHLFILSFPLIFVFHCEGSSGYTSTLVIVSFLTSLHRIASIHTCNVLLCCLSSLPLILDYIRHTRCVKPFCCHFRECSVFTFISILIDWSMLSREPPTRTPRRTNLGQIVDNLLLNKMKNKSTFETKRAMFPGYMHYINSNTLHNRAR